MGTYVSNRQTEIPTHFCWVCKKIFIFPDNGRDHDCLSCGEGTKLLPYFDDPLQEQDVVEAVARITGQAAMSENQHIDAV